MIKVTHVTTVAITLNFIRGHINYLKTHGYAVEIISSPDEYLKRFAEQLQVTAHAVEMPRRITPLRDLQSLLWLWSVLRISKPQIVHAYTPKGGLLGTIAAWLAGVPVRIYHILGLPFVTATGRRRSLLRMSEKISCMLATQVLCVSPSMQEIAVKEGLCPQQKIKVLANGSVEGVDAENIFNPSRISAASTAALREKYHIPADATVLGFVGRIVRDKGITELIAAWNILKYEFPSLHLLMVGMFEDQDPLPLEVEQQIRTDIRIHVTGYITENIAYHYALMTLFVLPTYREGFGVATIEAGAMELPAVTTRIPGCVDAVQEGITGTLIPPYNTDALIGAIRMYLNTPKLRHQHGRAARDRVLRDYKPEDIYKTLEDEYQRLLATKHLG